MTYVHHEIHPGGGPPAWPSIQTRVIGNNSWCGCRIMGSGGQATLGLNPQFLTLSLCR